MNEMTSGDGRHKEDPRAVLASLAATACPWHRVFDGLEITFTTRTTWLDGSAAPQTESFIYSQWGPRLWRLDLTLFDGLRTNICRYDDLCYELLERRYLRAGFESQTHASVEETLLARHPLMSEATAILGEPIPRMLRMPGFSFEALEEPRHEGITRRALWRFDGSQDGALPATGAIEWREEGVGALITHLEYRRDFPDAVAQDVILVDVVYRDQDGRLLPIRAVHTNGSVIEETVLEAVAPAVADRAHYSPQAFGLDVPA